MKVQLPTGTTITISAYEYLFVLKEEDVDAFYQACIADNLGVFIENPFSYTGGLNEEKPAEEVEDLELPEE